MRTVYFPFILLTSLLLAVLTVNGQCPSTADFSYSGSGAKIHFTNHSILDSFSINQVRYSWDFGDGSSPQQTTDSSSVSHTYSLGGYYNVSLIMEDSLNFCSDTASKSIYVALCTPIYKFEISFDTGRFHYTGPDTHKVFSWYFSDFTNYSSKNVTKIFSNPGQYSFILEVMDTLGVCSDTVSKIFTVDPFCKADFNYTVTMDSVEFNNLSTHYKVLAWDFGDATVSTQSNPLHIYDSSGIYAVCLTVSDSINQCIHSFCDSITVTVPEPCSSSFDFVQNLDTVWFSNKASNYTNMEWDFGDGSTSTAENPMHIYDSSASYIVCQSVMDTNRNCLNISCDTINILLPPVCSPSFSYIVNDSQVVFTNTSNNLNAQKFQWYFGDGSTSTSIHASHIYKESANYKVSLFMLDSLNGLGCRSTFTDSLDVEVLCKAHYTIAIDSSQKFKVYLINNSSDYSTHNYYWTFGDGSSSSGRTTLHEYNSFGKYEVCLKITDSDLNCLSTFCDSLGLDSNSALLRGSFILEVLDQSAIGMEENTALQKISLFPNPSRSFLNIDLMHMNNKTQLYLMDMGGKTVIYKEARANCIFQMDLGLLPSGMYFLKIADGNNGQIIKKIIH